MSEERVQVGGVEYVRIDLYKRMESQAVEAQYDAAVMASMKKRLEQTINILRALAEKHPCPSCYASSGGPKADHGALCLMGRFWRERA